MIHSCAFITPLGNLVAIADEMGLHRLEFIEDATPPLQSHYPAPLHSIAKELEQYFAGTLKEFTTPVHIRGTPFQQQVLSTLKTIRYGETISYSELAAMIDKPSAQRAVGGANNRNPLLIIIPCHRVIAADNTLRGFRAGVWRKQWLLDLELKHSLH